MRQVNRMKQFAVAAIGTAVLAGVSGYSAAILAQAPDSSPAQPPAVPTAQAPASPDAQPTAAPVISTVAQGGTILGTVKASGVPLPGVAVTATNTLTGKKYATSTDVDGAFQMAVPRNGRYVVKTELTGFASVTQEILINASSENGGLPKQTAEFKMDLASRVTAQATTTSATTGTTTATTSTAVARVGRGTQALAVQGGQDSDLTDASAGQANTGAQLPSLATSTGDDTATESIAVSGQQGQTNGLAGFSEDDLRNRIQDMQRNGFANGDIATTLTGVMQTGTFGPGGPGGGGPGGGEGGGIMIMGGGGGPGGGFGGGGGRGGGGFNGFGGGFRGQNANAWHGSVGYTGSNSALNANSYSVTGRAIDKPQSDRNSLVASFTGTPYIPGWTKPNPKQFLFLSLSETRNTSPSTKQIIVPTLAQRYGDLTGLGTIYDPTTGLQYPIATVPGSAVGCASQVYAKNPGVTSCIPSSELASVNSLAGRALLNYYPEPNVSSPLTQDNYQVNVPGTSDSSQVSVRYNRSFGATPVRTMRGTGGSRAQGGTTTRNRNAPPALRQSIAESFAYSHSASANSSFVPQLGGKSYTEGYSLSSAYTVGYGRINSTATLSWNRSRSIASNYFTNSPTNPAQDAGINVANSTIYNNPFYFGVPSISITGGYAGLSDATPSNSVNQTISFSDFLSYSHKKHNMRFGFDFRRIHADSIGGTNVLGSFTFSGYATENPAQQQCVISATQTCTFAASGSAIADLLLGLPQQTKITAGLNKIYLRGNSWDWYAQDDWRARSNLTFNYGLRWEYLSPYSEKYNHLVNLNLSSSDSSLQIANVCATAASGCASVGSPSSLVKPDKSLFSPRISIAWQPKSKWTKSTVVRSGYGINFNTGQYSRFATNLSFQQPFAITQTNTLSTPSSQTTCLLPSQVGTVSGTAMTLTNGFNCSTQSTQSNFGVNPNYRLGMVQSYNLGIQRTLPQGVVLNIDYIGAYAGNLDIVRAPNRKATGVLNPDSGQFNYEDSLGYQRSNALTISARQRMHKGVALQAAYTYSHSIDNASSVGGSGSSIAQDDQNLGAEESNSSFDRRHALNGTFIIEPPFGPNRAFLNKGGIFAKILDGYSISGNFSFASGNFQTPTYSGTAEEIATGANSLRPDRVPGTSIKGAGSHLAWFNKAAFTAPAAGAYGNASRNSIELPGTVSFSGSLSRTVSFGGTRSFEARINANNALNTVQYSGVDTTLNSATFGQVTNAAAMRSFTYNARFRF